MSQEAQQRGSGAEPGPLDFQPLTSLVSGHYVIGAWQGDGIDFINTWKTVTSNAKQVGLQGLRDREDPEVFSL